MKVNLEQKTRRTPRMECRNTREGKMMMMFTKDKTLAFTGHRFYEYRLHDKIVARLTATILEAYDKGIRCFISGCCQPVLTVSMLIFYKT